MIINTETFWYHSLYDDGLWLSTDTDWSLNMTLIRTSSHIPVSATVWLITGVIFGSMFGSRYLQEAIDLYNGYRWNYMEKCIINPGNFAGGYCRMPKECTCAGLEGIDDIPAAEMTSELFKERFVACSRYWEDWQSEYLQISADKQTCCGQKCLSGMGGDEGSGLLLAEVSVHQDWGDPAVRCQQLFLQMLQNWRVPQPGLCLHDVRGESVWRAQ